MYVSTPENVVVVRCWGNDDNLSIDRVINGRVRDRAMILEKHEFHGVFSGAVFIHGALLLINDLFLKFLI